MRLKNAEKTEIFINGLSRMLHMKHEIPQINPETGMSEDYANEYVRLFHALEDIKYALGYDFFNKYVVSLKKYIERYPIDKFVNVVTDKNRESIRRLDELVDEVNSLISIGSRQIDRYSGLVKNIDFLIYGRERVNISSF